MKITKNLLNSADGLRNQAEQRLKRQYAPSSDEQSSNEIQRLLHELQVHQIEMEMQNESLQAALAAAEAGQRFIDLYEFAPVAYFSVGTDSTIRLANLAGCRLLGLERSALHGQRVAAYVVGDDVPMFNTFLRQVLASGEIETCELRLHPSGKGNVVEIRIDAVADAQGVVCNLALTDITEHKRLEQNIRRADRDRQAILDNIPCLAWLKDEQSRYLAVNTLFAQTFNYPSPDALIGMNDLDVFSAEMAEGFRADDRWVIENGTLPSVVKTWSIS